MDGTEWLARWLLPSAQPGFEIANGADRAEHPPQDTFAWVWEPLWTEAERWDSDIRWLRSHMQGSTVVDLGGGRACLAAQLAEPLGVMRWIVVDIAHAPHAARRCDVDLHPQLQALPFSTSASVMRVAADALQFLRRVPDGSISAVVGGLDLDVVDDDGWHCALSRELARTVAPSGVVLHTESTCARWFERSGLLAQARSPFLDAVRAADALHGGGWLGTGFATLDPSRRS